MSDDTVDEVYMRGHGTTGQDKTGEERTGNPLTQVAEYASNMPATCTKVSFRLLRDGDVER